MISGAERMEAMGRQGCVVSVAFGPVGDGRLGWTVNILSRNNETFDRPFIGRSFDHCLDIAEEQINLNGWGMPRLMMARDEGRRAFQGGKLITDNPHPAFSKLNVEWGWGYCEGAKYSVHLT